MSKHLLRHFVSHPLPSLKQGSILQIRSSIQKTNINIRSQWRDDGQVSMLQNLGQVGAVEAVVKITKQKDKMTSMGREENHVLIQVDPKEKFEAFQTSRYTQSHPRAKDHSDEKKVILDDGSILPDSERWSHLPDGFRRIEYSDAIDHITDEIIGKQDEETSIELEVPEKVNLECDLSNGGSVFIHNKIEGDVHIYTTDGNVAVKKLRGHSINIHAEGPGNSISSSDMLEAETLNIALPNPGRLRAKKIHVKSFDVSMGGDNISSAQAPSFANGNLFDNDDSGALCDISSLYVTGEALINIKSPDDSKQAVRIKSNHGHVVVDATGPKPKAKNEMIGDIFLPLVDMGGINGSCEIFIRGDTSACDGWISGQIHIDSISPDSVSVIKADHGNLNITVDRKVESDLRLLSTSNVTMVDIDTIVEDCGDIDTEDNLNDDLKAMLIKIDKKSSMLKKNESIKIETKAFTSRNVEYGLENCEYIDGWIENKSEEPDSRFDRKIRGGSTPSGSVGKIRLEGAQDQALQSFRGEQKGQSTTFKRPLLVASSTGEIKLETLSWLGNIARRYGMDDGRDKEGLGRTATRRGRSLVGPDQSKE
jgi:hypothetical protein